MNEKQDTNFGETILELARKTYGEDFTFSKCTIVMHADEQFTVTFETETTEGVEPQSNFDLLSCLEKANLEKWQKRFAQVR